MMTIQRNLVDALALHAADRYQFTHLAGARVRGVASVLRIVSEGGGTMLMKTSLEFVNLLL